MKKINNAGTATRPIIQDSGRMTKKWTRRLCHLSTGPWSSETRNRRPTNVDRPQHGQYNTRTTMTMPSITSRPRSSAPTNANVSDITRPSGLEVRTKIEPGRLGRLFRRDQQIPNLPIGLLKHSHGDSRTSPSNTWPSPRACCSPDTAGRRAPRSSCKVT